MACWLWKEFFKYFLVRVRFEIWWSCFGGLKWRCLFFEEKLFLVFINGEFWGFDTFVQDVLVIILGFIYFYNWLVFEFFIDTLVIQLLCYLYFFFDLSMLLTSESYDSLIFDEIVVFIFVLLIFHKKFELLNVLIGLIHLQCFWKHESILVFWRVYSIWLYFFSEVDFVVPLLN